MANAIDKILKRYEGADFTLRMKARFLLSLCVAIIVIMAIVLLIKPAGLFGTQK